jgi:hypothetical protein
MTVEPREYEIPVCSKCGEQAAMQAHDGGLDRDCGHYDYPIVTVTIAAEWDVDPIKYGSGRRGLLVKPQAHLVPPPGS